MNKPIMKSVYETKELQDACEEYLDAVIEKKYSPESYKQKVFEAAMEMFYGKNIWDFVMNNVLEGLDNG